LLLISGIAGRSGEKREILYNDEVRLLEENQGRVLGVTSCYLYEMQFKTYGRFESVMLEVRFLTELEYEFLDENGICQRKIKKLSCRKYLYPVMNGISGNAGENGSLFLIPVIKDTAYRYSITGDGIGIRLTVSASVEYFATVSYYSNIYECGKEQPEPETVPGTAGWQTVYDNIRFDDILACLENFIRLLKIKGLFGGCENVWQEAYDESRTESEMKEENARFRDNVKSMEDEIKGLKMTIAGLRSELRERDYIINGLLELLDKSRRLQPD